MRFSLALALFLAPAVAPAADWLPPPWGADKAVVLAALGPAAETLDRPREYGGGLLAPLLAEDVRIGGLAFRAWFQFREGALVQVLLERRGAEAGREDAEALMALLAARFGPPDRTCAEPGRDGRPASSEADWLGEGLALHLVWLGFPVTERTTREPLSPLPRVVAPAAPAATLPAPRPVTEPVPVPRPRTLPGANDLPEGRPVAPERRPVPPPRHAQTPPYTPLALPPSPGLRVTAERRAQPARLLLRWTDPADAALAAGRCPD